ncbi:DUF427 domain-containing protein [Mesorhizobium sp. M0622]
MPSPKRLRVQVGSIVVADSVKALVLYESDHLPVYYFPVSDVREEFLLPSKTTTESPFKGSPRITRSIPASRWSRMPPGGISIR